MNDLLTLASAATLCGLSHATLRAYAGGRSTPRLPAFKVGKTWVVNALEFHNWLRLYRELPKTGSRR